jgi:hypothetical protein
MAKSRFLTLPSGQVIRPFMIGGMSPEEYGVVLVDSSNRRLGVITIDRKLYDADGLKLHIIKLLEESCALGKHFTQINWDEVFSSFELK